MSIAVPRARSSPATRRRPARRRIWLLLVLSLGLGLGMGLTGKAARADTVTPSGPRAQPDARARKAALNRPIKVLASRAHGFCPIGGTSRTVRTIDSRNEWSDTLTTDESGGLGRRVLWSREKVLVYAEDLQPATGRQLASATDLLRLKSGVLWWPVRDLPGNPLHTGVQPKMRPCVIAAVSRAQWHRVRVFKPGANGDGQ
ncbi:hypothetical protein EV685_0450 [Sphaerotilus mobilis]|uniref:Uncharacterized protein n=2 Tax=Sphaerotilus mobilis TaxID=47994 RepID=A0A4Q7LUG2_9BURK|nr:hypothetical protein EV685_0450 [Sphaerotilus mobilis]